MLTGKQISSMSATDFRQMREADPEFDCIPQETIATTSVYKATLFGHDLYFFIEDAVIWVVEDGVLLAYYFWKEDRMQMV